MNSWRNPCEFMKESYLIHSRFLVNSLRNPSEFVDKWFKNLVLARQPITSVLVRWTWTMAIPAWFKSISSWNNILSLHLQLHINSVFRHSPLSWSFQSWDTFVSKDSRDHKVTLCVCVSQKINNFIYLISYHISQFQINTKWFNIMN